MIERAAHEEVSKLSLGDQTLKSEVLALSELNLGPNAGCHLLQSFSTEAYRILKKKTAGQYSVVLCRQITKWFDSEDETLKNLECIDPAIALSGSITTLVPLMVRFPNSLRNADTKTEGKRDIPDVQWSQLESRKDRP